MSLLEKEREDNMSSLYKKNKKFYLLLILPALAEPFHIHS